MPSSRGSFPPGIEPRSPALQVDSLPFEPQILWDDNEKYATLKKALTTHAGTLLLHFQPPEL